MPITTMEELLAGPGSRKIYLATLRPGRRLRNWTATPGYDNTYEIGFAQEEAGLPREIARVEENGAEYEEKPSLAEVDATASAYYWDTSSGKLYISPAGPDPTDCSAFIVAWFEVRLSNESRDGSGRPLILGGNYFVPILTGVSPISSRSTDLFSSIGGAPSTCRLMLANADGSLDAALGEWIWVGGEVEIFFGGEDLALEAYEPIFRGAIAEAACGDDAVSLSLESGERIFTRTVPPNSFSLSDYPGLAESDAGKPVPLVLGRVQNIRPVRISHLQSCYIEFDGSSKYLKRPKADLVGIGFTGSFTAEFKLTLLGTGDSGAVFGIWSEADSKRSYVVLVNAADLKLRLYLSDTGASWPYARAETTVLRPLHEYTIRTAYDAATHSAAIQIDGVEQSIYYSETLPTSILAADADFTVGCTHGLTNPLQCRLSELTLADGYHPGAEELTQVVSRWSFDGSLDDEAGQNSMVGVNISDGDYRLNHGLRLPGAKYAYISDSAASGLDITGPITIAARLQPTKFGQRQGIVAKWAETSNQRSYQLEFLSNEVRLCLSPNGTSAYVLYTTGAELQVGQWYEIKATYDTVSKAGRIYINGEEAGSSSYGTAPGSLFNSDADVRVGAQQLGPNFVNAVIDWAGIAGSYQPDAGPIKDIVSFWEFGGGLEDSAGGNDLSPYAIESDDYVVLSAESEYKIADDTLQRLQGIDAVRDGEVELTAADFDVDLPSCVLRLHVSVADELLVDARGATMGDLLGNGSEALITRAPYIARFLLERVAGQRAGLFDEDSFAAASAGAPMELNLYLDRRGDLGSVLKQICDSVPADLKVRGGRYGFHLFSPSAADDCVELREEDLAGFTATVDPHNIWREVSVRYACDGSGGFRLTGAVLPEALFLYGRELARREFETRLVNQEDAEVFLQIAKLLARSRQLTLKARVITPVLMNSGIGDKVRVTRGRAAGGPLERSSFEITAIDKDYATGACNVALSALRGLSGCIARFTGDDHPGWAGSDEWEKREGGYFTDDAGRADAGDPESGGRNLYWR